MKALTLNQPWGSLFLTPEKQWETRGRRILFRGWLAVHTSKEFAREHRALCALPAFQRALRQSVGVSDPGELVLGCVIGVVRITGCIKAEQVARAGVAVLPQGPNELSFGDFARGRFAWQRHAHAYTLPHPVPCSGNRGLWDLPRDVEDAVVEQLRRQTGSGRWVPSHW